MEKKCVGCKEFKSIEHFFKDKTRKDGYNNKCKICSDNNIYNRSKKIKKIKMKYPRGVIKDNLYTAGGRFHLNNKPYIGWYHSIDGQFFSGASSSDGYSKKLIQFQTEFPKEKIKIESYKPNIKYFTKRINEGFAKSIGLNDFNNYSTNVLYKTVKVDLNDIESVNKAKELIPELKNLI